MAGNTLAVDIVAKTTGLTSGLAEATAQLDAFSASVSHAADTQAAASGEQSLRSEAMTTAQVWVSSRRAMIDAETRANTLLRAGRKADVASLGDALATMEQRRDAFLAATRAYYGSMTSTQQAAFAEQEAAANREIEAEYQRLAARLDDATAIQTETAALEENTVATAVNGSTAREATYMIDEIASGRFRRLGGSSVVLANRMGILSGLFTPLGLSIAGTAVAVGTLGVAMVEGERDADALNAAMLSTNDAAGVTQSTFQSMAAAIAGGDITIGNARAALLTLAQSGRFTGSTLQEAAQAAVDFADLTDSSMKQASQAVEQIAERPLTALVKLNDQYHFLTTAEYEQIAALQQEGNATAAAKAAIDAFGTAMHARAEQSVRDEGYIVRAFEAIKNAAVSTWSALKSVGSPETYAQKLANLKAKLAEVQGGGGFTSAAGYSAESSARAAHIQSEIRALELAHQKNVAAAKLKAENDQINAAGIRAVAYLEKQVASLKTVNVEMARERELTAQIEALHRADPNSKLLQGDTFNSQGHLTKGNAIYDQLIASFKRKAAAAHASGVMDLYGRLHLIHVTAQDETSTPAYRAYLQQQERITEQVNAIEEGAARRHAQAMLQIKIERLRTAEAEGQITHAQELADEEALYQQEYTVQLAAYQKELALAKDKPALTARINAEIEALQDAHLQRMTAAQESAAQKQAQAFQQAFQPISSAFTTSINGIIQGTQTMQMAVGRMLDSVLLKYIDTAIQSTVHWVAEEAQKTMATVTGTETRTAVESQAAALQRANQELDLIAHMQTEAGKTAETVVGEGARTSAVVTGTATRIAVVTAAHAQEKASSSLLNMATIRADAAKAAAGAYSAVVGIPYVGPVLAPIAAATAFAAVGAYEAMASFGVGAWNIPHDMPAMVHAGETILPRPFAEEFRRNGGALGGGIGGGGVVENHYHIHANDAASFHDMLQRNPEALAAGMSNAIRVGAFA
ncbi:MAG: phage tail length tape measure family protein [Steroidobacteraceae bacterium]